MSMITLGKRGTLLCLASAAMVQAETVRIESGALSVAADTAAGTIACLFDGKTFLCDARVGGVALVAAKKSGAGMALTLADGRTADIKLAEGSPFVLLRCATVNTGASAAVFNRQTALVGGLGERLPPVSLRALGTGGLQPPEKNTGSYMWLALADASNRSGLVAGWVTCDRGNGVLFSPATNGSVGLEARVDYGKLHLKPGADEPGEWLAIGWFADARLGLEAYADAVAKHYAIRLPPQPSGFCTWYTDKYSGACDEKHIVELSEFAARELKPFGFDFVQIDDKWQAGISSNGPKREFMRVAPNGPYPGGMKPTAERIAAIGLTPGIWFMPFAGTSYDPFFADHQDWFIKGPDGKPFETRWGGTCLDMTHPGAREYLRQLVDRIAHEWGYRVFKMDGLWTGTGTRLMYVNNGYTWDEMGEVTLSDPEKTQIEAYRDGLKLVRKTAGRDVFLLGCCVSQNMRSFGGAYGLVDAMRVGPDTGSGHIGAPHASRNYFLHGRVWQNDPDCVSVRKSTPLDQARVNATFTTIAGHLFYNSDWMPDLPPERLDILKRTMPAHGLLPRPVDLFEHEPARIWHLQDTRRALRRDTVALYNWDQKQPAEIVCPVERFGLPAAKEYVAFDFWANRFVPPFRGQLASVLPPASCRVLAIKPTAAHPQLLGTSRHVTQGMVDVLEERWDAGKMALRGTSKVVAGDVYELRVIVPHGPSSWELVEFTADGEKTSFAQSGPRIRARFTSPSSRDVAWRMVFKPAPVEVAVPPSISGLKAVAEYDSVTLMWNDAGADEYRVTRDDGFTVRCAAPLFTDASVGHGRKYTYSVASLGWGETASKSESVDVSTPAELKQPATPPQPNIPLPSLKPSQASLGWGSTPGQNRSISGKSLRVGGKTYESGIGVHAASTLVYGIPAGSRRFVAVVGLDDEKKTDPRSSVVFEVYGDVREMGEAPVLLAKSPRLCDGTTRTWAFDVELNVRYKDLRLVVTDAGDGIASDHADWVNAGFVTK